MYTACLFCNSDLGANHFLPTFPVGCRVAFDQEKGRLWVICPRCGRWNLTPLEERWEAIEKAEQLYRGTRLRLSTDNVGLAQFRGVFELVRIGPALLPEMAAWRYGTRLVRRSPAADAPRRLLARAARMLARTTGAAIAGYAHSIGLTDEALLRLRTLQRAERVLVRAREGDDEPLVIRYRHLGGAQLIRPERDAPWRLWLEHDGGHSVVARSAALRIAGKLLATLNVGAASDSAVQFAVAKLDAAANPDGYFSRVVSLALRTSWGRDPRGSYDGRAAARGPLAERLAVQLSSRSFWGRGGTDSEERTALYRLPAVDRLALEMAASEDMERHALLGELEALHAAWKEAEEIAAIADALFTDDLLEEFRRRYDARVARER